MVENGTTILKFFLHISKDEQKERFQKRLDNPSKRWKFNAADLEERKHWNKYWQAFEDVFSHCSHPWAPWYVIPADRKWFRNVLISEIIAQTLEKMKCRIPRVDFDVKKIRIPN